MLSQLSVSFGHNFIASSEVTQVCLDSSHVHLQILQGTILQT